MNIDVVIPAIESNKYHKLGDLAPFGDTTLLQWKIAQCKEFIASSNIYVSSDSKIIENIVKSENINFIKRSGLSDYSQIIKETVSKTKNEFILWANPTSPFLSSSDYKNMIDKFFELNVDSVISVYSKYDYAYFNDEKLNFENKFIPRKDITPIKILTNGCYIIKKEIALTTGTLFSDNPYLYDLDYLSSVEIKDIHLYNISQELISSYFKKDLHV